MNYFEEYVVYSYRKLIKSTINKEVRITDLKEYKIYYTYNKMKENMYLICLKVRNMFHKGVINRVLKFIIRYTCYSKRERENVLKNLRKYKRIL